MIDRKKQSFHTDSFTRGGQIFAHQWRMRFQNLKIVMLLGILFGLFGIWLCPSRENLNLWLMWDFYMLSYLSGKIKLFLWPWIQPLLIDVDVFLRGLMKGSKGIPSAYKKLSQLTTDVWVPNQGRIYMRTFQFLNNTWVLQEVSKVHRILWWGLGSWSFGMGLMIWQFRAKSQKIEQDKIMRGKETAPLSKVAKSICQQGRSAYEIAPKLPLPKDAENQHLALIGATRMGKTTCLKYLLDQVRSKGHRAVILDSTGELTNRYFRPNKDILINPFDARTSNWTIWGEDLKDYEYDAWSAAMIPEGKGDPIWHGNARKLLAFTAQNLQKQNAQPLMKDILKWCCWEPLGQTTNLFYENSAVAALMTKEAEKTAVGVRMQVSNYISAFEYLPQSSESFSITKWVKDRKQDDTWLFLQALPTQRNTLAPFLASLFNFAFMGLERAGVDFENRLWMIADEVGGWDFPIASLKRLVTEGAKYGACCALGFQNKSQIDHLYSHAGTKTLLSNCSTKVIFRSQDHETAKDLSLTLGEQDILVSSENFSIGSHHMRDGVNLSSQYRTQAAIPATEIMSLNPLEAYVLLPGNYPAAKVKYKVKT